MMPIPPRKQHPTLVSREKSPPRPVVATGRSTTQPTTTAAVEDDLICPITLHLPYDPVMAEDGRIYEGSAIENHIKGRKGRGLKSPITHEKMGEKLLPAPQIKNAIETLINTGVIVGELAKHWKQQDQQQKKRMNLIQKAENGDVRSITLVGYNYRYGDNGFPQDNEKAFWWLEKAHRAGDYRSTFVIAEMLLNGYSNNHNHLTDDNTNHYYREKLGTKYLGLAANGGCDSAAFLLGLALANGSYGLDIQKTEAIKWLRVALNGKYMSDNQKSRVKNELQKLAVRS